MCYSFKKTCRCGQRTADIFFGNMVLNEAAVAGLFCPACSQAVAAGENTLVRDNGWVLELDMAVVRQHAPSMGAAPDEITAAWTFDAGYVTWVGITPDDTRTRDEERAALQKLAKTDLLAYYEAMKTWGRDREARFAREGWRKMRGRRSDQVTAR
jgi:hypothetical protein